MTESDKLLALILNIGVEMIECGAETHRVEDSLYRICQNYNFSDCNVWVVPSNIQATVTTPDGSCVTQIRHIKRSGIDFGRLDELNALSRRICAEKPSSDLLSSWLESGARDEKKPVWIQYLAGALAGGGFGVFFNCDPLDAAVAVCSSLLVIFLSHTISKKEDNPLILNFIISFLAEIFVIFSVKLGFGHHVGYIAAGVVMLLISALGTTNGIRDLIGLDTLSGVMNISLSITGAIGIAMGIILPLQLFGSQNTNEIMVLNQNLYVELLSCLIACLGFAIWFNVKKKHVIWCAIGGFLTWGAYLICYSYVSNEFWSTLVGASVCSLFSQIMARVNKAPATIFQTVAVLPIIPGAALYYSVYGMVIGDYSFMQQKGLTLLLSCFGIVMGFLLIQVLSRYIWQQPKR